MDASWQLLPTSFPGVPPFVVMVFLEVWSFSHDVGVDGFGSFLIHCPDLFSPASHTRMASSTMFFEFDPSQGSIMFATTLL